MLTVVGYLDRLSAGPGDEVAVKVGAYGARTYRADLRRIVQGDRNPDGPGYRDEPVELDLGGTRPARPQPIRPGSYAQIADRNSVLASLVSFTLAVPVWPTRAAGTERVVLSLAGAGAELSIDASGRAKLKVARARSPFRRPSACAAGQFWSQATTRSTACSAWRFLTLSEGESGAAECPSDPSWSASGLAYVLIAARAEGECHFDGKINSPVVFARTLAPVETFARLADPARLARLSDLVALWDFARGSLVPRSSTHHPTTWTGSCTSPRARRDRMALGWLLPGLDHASRPLQRNPFPR